MSAWVTVFGVRCLFLFPLTSRADNPLSPKCAALEAEWLAIQEEKEDENIVSFDCGAHYQKCKELEVAALPAVRVYHRDGRVNYYRGNLNRREYVSFLLSFPSSRMSLFSFLSLFSIPSRDPTPNTLDQEATGQIH